MIQSISSGNISIGSNISTMNNEVASSDNFSNILEQASTISADQNASGGTSEASADKLKEMTSELTICEKCCAIYMGKSVTICSKCGNDISKQDQDNQQTTESNYNQKNIAEGTQQTNNLTVKLKAK